MSQDTLRADARTMPAASRPRAMRKDMVDDLSFLPDRYGMVCAGDCLEPEIKSGSVLIFDKREPFKVGDLVIIYRRPDLIPKGRFQSLVKRLVMAPPSWVTFPWRPSPDSQIAEQILVEMLNPAQQFFVRCADIIGIHKCLGAAPPEVRPVFVDIPKAYRTGSVR